MTACGVPAAGRGHASYGPGFKRAEPLCRVARAGHEGPSPAGGDSSVAIGVPCRRHSQEIEQYAMGNVGSSGCCAASNALRA